MGSETNSSLRLPVIDFSVQALKPQTPEWESVRDQVREALEEFGCFEALFNKIPINLREREIFEATQEFFDLPLETKQLNISKIPIYSYRSYGKNTQSTIPHEAVIIEHVNIGQKVESFTNVSWPQGNTRFCKTIHSYSEQLSELDRVIKRMIFESLGIEKHFEEHLKSTDYSLRVIKYKHPESSEDTKKMGLTEHTDKGLITILNQNQVDGLEVQTKDGQWISVKPSPGTFVVVLGEVFSYVLTNGRLYCPLHRVVMTGNKTRYSNALFSNTKEDYLIKTPEELVDEEHPLVFKPFYFFDFLKFFLTVDKKDHQSALKAYCGI